MRQGDYITDRDSAIDFYSLRPPFLDCLSAGSSFTPLVFELKITPEQSKTMISQYITTPLKTEQAKLQQNKIESVFFFFFFQFFIFIHESVRHQSHFPLLLPRHAILILPLPHNPVHCALCLPRLSSAAQSHGRKTLRHSP